MAHNKTFLKNILTTTSLLALTLAASDAMAAGRKLNAGGTQNLVTNNEQLAETGSGKNKTRWKEGDGLQLTNDRTTLIVSVDANAISKVSTIDTNGQPNAVLNVGASDFALGNVNDTKAHEEILEVKADKKKKIKAVKGQQAVLPQKLNINFSAATSPFTLNGTNYQALGDINLLKSNQPLIVDSDVTIESTIKGTDKVGKIQVGTTEENPKNVTFKGPIGQDKSINQLTVKKGSTAIIDTVANFGGTNPQILLEENSIFKMGPTADVTGADIKTATDRHGTFEIEGRNITLPSNAGEEGSNININFASDNALTIQNNKEVHAYITTTTPGTGSLHTSGKAMLGGTIGTAANPLQSFTMKGSNDNAVNIAAGLNNIYATNITQENVIFAPQDDLKLHGEYKGTNVRIILAAQKTLTFDGNATLEGHNKISFSYNAPNEYSRISGPINFAAGTVLEVEITVPTGIEIGANTEISFFNNVGDAAALTRVLHLPAGWVEGDTLGTLKFALTPPAAEVTDVPAADATGTGAGTTNSAAAEAASNADDIVISTPNNTPQVAEHQNNAPQVVQVQGNGQPVNAPQEDALNVDQDQDNGQPVNAPQVAEHQNNAPQEDDQQVVHAQGNAPQVEEADTTPIAAAGTDATSTAADDATSTAADDAASEHSDAASEHSDAASKYDGDDVPHTTTTDAPSYTSSAGEKTDTLDKKDNKFDVSTDTYPSMYETVKILSNEGEIHPEHSRMKEKAISEIQETYGMSQERAAHMLKKDKIKYILDSAEKYSGDDKEEYLSAALHQHALVEAATEKREEHSYHTIDNHTSVAHEATLNTVSTRTSSLLPTVVALPLPAAAGGNIGIASPAATSSSGNVPGNVVSTPAAMSDGGVGSSSTATPTSDVTTAPTPAGMDSSKPEDNSFTNNEAELEASASGVAAGDAYERFGVWAQVVGGVAKQKARKGGSGFKSNLVGGMLGVDTLISDKTIIGVAAGNMINNVKLKDVQAGDKSRSSSWVFSGYAHQQLEAGWFIRGSVAYTKTAVDNKDLRAFGIGREGIARAKYNIHTFGGEISVGKAIATQEKVIVTPSIGIRDSYTKKISYQETGITGLNHASSQKASNSMQAVAGLQVMKIFDKDGVSIMPAAHANIIYGLGVKAPTGKYTSEIANNKAIAYVGSKPSRLSANIGFDLTAESGSVEYGIGYDANIAAGYIGHQGSLKLKVKF